MKNFFNITILFFIVSNSAFAFDNKIKMGSDKVEPNQKALEFFGKFKSAITSKNIADMIELFAPTSKKCFKETKHPEYYNEELKRWFVKEITSFNELRKFKANYDFNFHKLMNYPENPTHVAKFNVSEQINSKTFNGWMSIEMLEKDGQFYLSYRCM